MIRYGLIGAGMMGQEHLRNLALIEGAQAAALADPDDGMRRAAAALAPGAATFAEAGDLLSAGLCDALIVAAPNDLHLPLMLQATQAGLPILCEKPLGLTAAECARIEAAATAPVWVAMEYRYMAPVARLLELSRRGEAGRLRMLSIREHRFPFLDKVGDWNRFNARTGGTLVEKCCHFFDLMRLILDAEPRRVFASGGVDVNHRDERYDGRAPDILDNAYVVVEFEGGARAMLDLCMFAEGSEWQEVVSAAGDLARIDAMVPGPARFSADGREREAKVVVSRRDKRVTEETPQVDPRILRAGDHHGATYYQHAAFARMLREGGAPEVGLRDGRIAVAVGEAAERSVREGRVVDLPAEALA
ncbi:MAG: Gfo/Idh/MocA family oxidoreductase [Pseudomonadota bacterium]